MSDLKPCPFCGRAPKMFDRADSQPASGHYWFIVCHCGGYSAHAHQHADSPEAVLEAWNTRFAPQGSGEHKLVADSPTFAYSLAMFLTRNGQGGSAPEMQKEIEMFMRDSRQSETLKS